MWRLRHFNEVLQWNTRIIKSNQNPSTHTSLRSRALKFIYTRFFVFLCSATTPLSTKLPGFWQELDRVCVAATASGSRLWNGPATQAAPQTPTSPLTGHGGTALYALLYVPRSYTLWEKRWHSFEMKCSLQRCLLTSISVSLACRCSLLLVFLYSSVTCFCSDN